MPDNPYVDFRLSGHVDLCMFDNGRGTLYASSHLKNLLPDYAVTYLNANLGPVYPEDVRFNACRIGNCILANPKTVDCRILAGIDEKDILKVNQGYTNCCTLVLNDHAAITSDRGIAEVLERKGISVLQIRPGFISLPGFDTGFIGGCGFLFDDNILMLTGHLKQHPDEKEVLKFIADQGLQVCFLSGFPVFDIGGAIVIKRSVGG